MPSPQENTLVSDQDKTASEGKDITASPRLGNEKEKKNKRHMTQDLTWKNPSNKKGKKPRAPTGEISLYRGGVTHCWGFHNDSAIPSAVYERYT
jgi:hypothetical protein